MLHNFHHTAESAAEAGAQALEAGMDLEAPSEYGFGQSIKGLLDAGRISMEAVDRAVERILSVKFRLGLFEEPVSSKTCEVGGSAHKKIGAGGSGRVHCIIEK